MRFMFRAKTKHTIENMCVCVVVVVVFLRMVYVVSLKLSIRAFVIGHGVWLIVVYTKNGVMLTHC